jgi:hypothetical protein
MASFAESVSLVRLLIWSWAGEKGDMWRGWTSADVVGMRYLRRSAMEVKRILMMWAQSPAELVRLALQLHAAWAILDCSLYFCRCPTRRGGGDVLESDATAVE